MLLVTVGARTDAFVEGMTKNGAIISILLLLIGGWGRSPAFAFGIGHFSSSENGEGITKACLPFGRDLSPEWVCWVAFYNVCVEV